MRINLVNLQGHLEMVAPEDLLLIAFHDGKSHSVTLKQADWTDIDDVLAFELRDYALKQELADLQLNSSRGI